MPTADAPTKLTGLRSDEAATSILAEVLGPARGSRDGTGATDRWVVLPRSSRPRYVVPISPRRAAAAVRFRPSKRRAVRAATSLLGLALRLGGTRLIPSRLSVPRGSPDDPSMVRWFEQRLDLSPLSVAIALGRPRPNRKPVLQLIGPDGTTIGWAKVSVDDHTAELVRNEARFLTDADSDVHPLVLPTPLVHDRWRGHEVLVLGDLGDDLRGHGALRLESSMITRIAELGGPITEGPPLASPWWDGLQERLALVGGDEGTRLAPVVRSLAERLGPATWRFGTWHGDLAPWNAHRRGADLVVWDWERAERPVPVGFDAIHARFQFELLRRGRPPADAVRSVLDEEVELLRSLGYEHGAAEALVDAYLLHLRGRMALDAAHGDLGRGRWLARSLTEALLRPDPPERRDARTRRPRVHT